MQLIKIACFYKLLVLKEKNLINLHSAGFEKLFKELGTVERDEKDAQKVTIKLRDNNQIIKDVFQGIINVDVKDNTINKVSTVSPAKICDLLFKSINQTSELSEDWKKYNLDTKISTIKQGLNPTLSNSITHN